MDFVIFEKNKALVLEALRNGEFDYIEAASEVFETDFFRFIGANQILQKLAQTYPSPRKKQEVPLWVYVASNLSMRLLFDGDDHPVSREAYQRMTDQQKSRCQWRRCYKMVTLLHTNPRLEFFIFVAVKIILGKDNECPVLYELVKAFVETVGKGVMKRLILDRGFLDGQAISTCKKDYEIDILIPVRRTMDVYQDAMALFGLPEVGWTAWEKPVTQRALSCRQRPKPIVKREQKRHKKLQQIKEQKPPPPPDKTIVMREAAAIGEFRSWSSCRVPLTVVANREHYADGHKETWLLIDPGQSPERASVFAKTAHRPQSRHIVRSID